MECPNSIPPVPVLTRLDSGDLTKDNGGWRFWMKMGGDAHMEGVMPICLSPMWFQSD